jgi:hypothetical protein
MDLVAIVEQLHIVGGESVEEAAPGLLYGPAPPRSARGREREQLFIHLTLSGPAEERAALCMELARSVRQTFFHTEGSATAALRRAVLDLNEQLLHLNLSSKGRGVEGAITCAALRGDELFTLQVGEALAFLGHHFGIERLAAGHGGNRNSAAIIPLGRQAGIDSRFTYHRLQAGDMLLLAEPRLSYLSGEMLSEALVDSDILSALETLSTLITAAPGGTPGQALARLLLVEFSDQSPTYLSVVSRSRRNPLANLTAPKQTAVPSTLPVSGPQSGPLREGGRSPLRASTPRAVSAPDGPEAGEPTETALSADTEGGGALPAVEPLGNTARRAASQSARGLSSFTGWLAELLGRLRSPVAGAEPAPMALPMLLAVVIPVVVAVVVTSVYLQRGRVQQLADIKLAMAQNMTLAAEASGDAVAARGFYGAVLALGDEADTLRPGDGEVDRMQMEAREQLDRLDGITRLSAELLYTYDEAAQMEAVVLREDGEGGIFTLDQMGNTVYWHETDEDFLEFTADTPESVVFSSQVVGNQVVGPITDMLWRPQGAFASRDGLVMLDRTGVLFTFYPNFSDLRSVALGFSSFWQEPVAITAYSERLYVLDRGAGQIWKYFPQDEGFVFDEADQAIFFGPEADLGQAVDFDIYSEDGSLLIAYEDGRVRYYDTRSGRISWDESTLMNNGLNTPLVAPSAVKLIGRGLNASIFIADPGTNRIVQVSRGGTVLTQYRVTDEAGQELFGRMSEFDVAEFPLRIFVVAGNQLYVVTQE